ncbi:TRAF-like superfamily protein [Zea mays]|nr:TRAF-like superfamily protein [Zea mays]
MEREERRLTELGQKILETFVLSHIFSGIEVAYQEAVALKRQEELIREEEEEAGLLEHQMKGKRGGGVNEKDKRAKKKQTKQKKNRKAKDKERDEKCEVKILERLRDETAIDNSDGLPSQVEVIAKIDALEEGSSDGSDMSNSVTGGLGRNSSGCCTAPKLDQDTVLLTLRDRLRKLGQRLHEKNIEGQKLLKKHFEARDAKAKEEPSDSSNSLDKPPDVPEIPVHSSEDTVDLKVNGTPKKDASVVNPVLEDSVSGIPVTANNEPVPSPTTTKMDPVSNKVNGSSLKMKVTMASPCSKSHPADMDKDASLPSKSPRTNRAAPVPPKLPSADKATLVPSKLPSVDKATPVPQKSPLVNKVAQARPKSPAVDKATPHRPKSPAVDKATPVRSQSPAVDKATLVRPQSPAVDKATPLTKQLQFAQNLQPLIKQLQLLPNLHQLIKPLQLCQNHYQVLKMRFFLLGRCRLISLLQPPQGYHKMIRLLCLLQNSHIYLQLLVLKLKGQLLGRSQLPPHFQRLLQHGGLQVLLCYPHQDQPGQLLHIFKLPHCFPAR